MKLIVKTLNGKQLPIEVEQSWSISEIKNQIEKEHELKAETLKLIAYGKVLEPDEKLASEYSLKEGDFIVAMVQKAKPVAKPKPLESVQPSDPVQNPVPSSSPKPQPTAAQPTSPEMEAKINELMMVSSMSREMCIQALRAADNNADLAFEFLLSGNIPQRNIGQPNNRPQAHQQPNGLDPEIWAQFLNMINAPEWPMIQMRLRQDPAFAAAFMQQVEQNNPQLNNAFRTHPELLMILRSLNNQRTGNAGRQLPPGAIEVSVEEMEAINRLVSLGFQKNQAAEAYFACDKNEEMAANFLFESGGFDDNTVQQPSYDESAEIARALQASQNEGTNNADQVMKDQSEEKKDESQSKENEDQADKDNLKEEDKKDNEGDGSTLT